MAKRSVRRMAAVKGLLILCAVVAQSSGSAAGAYAPWGVWQGSENPASGDCDHNAEQDPEQARADEELKRSVLENLAKSRIEGVQVCARRGIVTLTGAIRRDQFADAIRATHEATPRPKKVKNNLRVREDE